MRGEIQNRERKKQIVDFSGLQFPHGITPTDIDGFVEFDDRLFIWFELKLQDAPMPNGQRLALERKCDAIAQTGRHAIVFIAEHNITDPSQDINAAICTVRELRHNGRWRPPQQPVTLRGAVDKMLEMISVV